MFTVSWELIKAFVDDRDLSIQYVETDDYYELFAIDGALALNCRLIKDIDDDTDVPDFEANYKNSGNEKVDPTARDSDGAPLNRVKITTTGWHYQLHGVELQTSQLDSLISKKPDGTNFGYATIKCYDDEDVELTTQESCDTDAVKTIINWEPTHDYEIMGGLFKQTALPGSDIRMWVIGVPDVPAGSGGSKLFAANLNLRYMGLEEGMRVDGRAPKYLTYNATYHTNKLQIIFKHNVGVKHNMHIVFELFKA